MTYLNYAPEIQAMIYTTNWIERLNRDFRRVTRMRTAFQSVTLIYVMRFFRTRCHLWQTSEIIGVSL